MASTLTAPPTSALLTYGGTAPTGVADVEIVIPVYNEQDALAVSITRLQAYLARHFPLTWMITIADNASVDATWPIACRLAHDLEGVRAVHLDAKGRGRALRAVWSTSRSPVVAYMDVDLSTDLTALLPLVAPLLSGHSDIAIGTRLAATSRVARGPKREAISRAYNLLLRTTLHAGFSDAQCGFKAARTDALRHLLPLVEDDGWFFDTELLVLAEHNGLRIHEVPVDWVDDPDSRVHIASTARTDLAGVWRMWTGFLGGRGLVQPATAAPAPALERRPLAEQLVRFGSIGVISTAAFAVLVAVLSPTFGVTWSAIAALASCTIANNAANRRVTFALSGGSGRIGHHGRGLVAAALPLAAMLSTLGLLALAGGASMPATLLALTVVNVATGLGRFLLLDRWVFATRTSGPKAARSRV